MMDLTDQMKGKVAQLQAARAALDDNQERARALQTHILRLEGAITQLRELGAALPEGVVETPGHPGLNGEAAADASA